MELQRVGVEFFPPTKTESATWLCLNGSQMERLPDGFEKFPSLKHLILSGNMLSELPRSLSTLTNLSLLDISSNQFSCLPVEIRPLRNLEELYIENNMISALPVWLNELTKLFQLVIESNGMITVRQMPHEICNLPCWQNGSKGKWGEANITHSIKDSLRRVHTSTGIERISLTRNTQQRDRVSDTSGDLKLSHTIGARLELASRGTDNSTIDYEAIDKVLSQYNRIDNYSLSGQIGKGGYGIVHRAYWNHRSVAVKSLSLLEGEVVLNEMNCTYALRTHPYIVQIYGFSRRGHELNIVMELASMSLHDKIKSEGALPITTSLTYGYMIASALNHAKSSMILHRDIKTENILCFPNNTVKLTDFGLAHFDRTLGMTSIYTGTKIGEDGYGTDKWQAPEVAIVVSRSPVQSDEENIGHRGELSDVYSFGLVLWSMLTGDYPYYGVVAAYYEKSIGIRPCGISKMPKPLQQIIKCCIKINYRKRPKFDCLFKILHSLKDCPPAALETYPMSRVRELIPSSYSRIYDMHLGELCEFLEDHNFSQELIMRVQMERILGGFFSVIPMTTFKREWLTVGREQEFFEQLLRVYEDCEDDLQIIPKPGRHPDSNRDKTDRGDGIS